MDAELRFPRLLIVSALLAVFWLVGCGQEAEDGHDHAEHAGRPQPAKAGSDDLAPVLDDHADEDADEHADEHDEDADDHGDEHDEDADDHADDHDEHAGHDEDADDHGDEHAEDDHTDDHDAHAEDADHGAEKVEHDDEHEGHEDEIRVELTPAQRSKIGLKLAVASHGSIAVSSEFPGEIALDPDRVVHVVPRVAGIVREAKKTLGEHVDPEEILAWIESDELVEAKLAYYSRQAEIGTCRIRLPRARAIFENVNRLLDLLEKEPDPEALRKLDDLEMGEYRGQLLTAYAEYWAARSAHEQEEALRTKRISSERERIEAETAHKKAQAELLAAKGTARYRVLLDFSEEARQCQVAEFEGAAAEQRLRLKGAGDDVVNRLRALVPPAESLEPCRCAEPGCEHGKIPSVLTEMAKDERFGWTALRAPIGGFVIDKHLSLGEKVDGEESVFVIADTSTVWVRFHVHQKDLAAVRPGLKVRVSAGTKIRDGVIAYLSPIVDEATRTVPARIVLENPDGNLRPGLFAAVRVDLRSVRGAVVVPKAAVQVVEEREVVFVEEEDGFVAVPVTLGSSDRERVVVTSGLRAGQRYVVDGAFELKAKLATSGLGAHAGHGH